MSISLKKIIAATSTFNILINKVLSGKNIHVSGLSGSMESIILALLSEKTDRPLLVIIPDQDKTETLVDEVSFLTNKKIDFYPGGEEEADTPLIVNPRRAGLKMSVLRNLNHTRLNIVFTTPEGIGYRLPPPEWMRGKSLILTKENTFDLYELVETLIQYGYTREGMVERPGEISLRGGILDVFPYTGESPFRFEFFGDQIASVRTIDIQSQMSKPTEDSLEIIPSSLAWNKRGADIFSYFSQDILIYMHDPDIIFSEIENSYHNTEKNFMPADEIKTRLNQFQTASHYTLSKPKDIINFGGSNALCPAKKAKEIKKYLKKLCASYEHIIITCRDKKHCERIKDFLDFDEIIDAGISIIVYPVYRGFLISRESIAVFSDDDLLGRKFLRKKSKRKFKTGTPIRELSSLKHGDFVVHIDYGIGIYRGLKKITIKDSTRECLEVQYKDSDKLYVPVEKMERIQKYSGGEGVKPTINKLGSNKWEKTKKRTKESIKNITKDLIQLYSEREAVPGHAFPVDTVWQKELEDSFLYEETPGQAKAMEEVCRDMESTRAMDRLICGDVGFGKTEVAVRAAFKAVNDSKQTAILVPTTILAQQHFQTFSDRLSSFPVTVEVLSRFKSVKQQKKIIENLKLGLIDIVVGTHRLLSKDVKFRNLGLLIIDEEQRFGVGHKEKLKMLRKNVDVLALSATPIPRTLQLSMLSIRDMSLINTPPEDRLPIVTEVTLFNEKVIIEAILRELNRNGQIFFVHNRIRSITAVARMIQKLVPGIRLAVAHGRMEEKELERVMIEFGEKKYDCLVSTMIIGSGLDLPNVNTLIVHRADLLGLSQLYQLRGRVGRSDKKAYAYLLTPPFHLMSKDAVNRLRTIEEFTELGSGIQIAMRDLEIRGAGNLLGARQSGNIDAVGFDLYLKIVREAVDEIKNKAGLKTEKASFKTDCSVDIEMPAYIPENYVPYESQRVNLYRSLSSVEDLREIDSFEEQLLDRFGPLPPETKCLLHISELRVIGRKKGIKRILIKQNKLLIFFSDEWLKDFKSEELLSEQLSKIVKSSPVPIRFLQGDVFGVQSSIKKDDPFSFTKKLLQSWD